MFVRFRETSRRLQLSLVETRREGGKVRHEHVASFGAIATPLTVAGRVEFWQDLHQRLGRLSNRLDSKMQVKILGAVHARVPMPTVDEIHALNLEEAKQHETAWRARYVRTEAIVEENKARLKAAERMVTRGEPLVATAAEEVKAAEQRRERIERGESVSLPGKVPTLKELGITPAHAEYMIAVSQLAPEQFERFLEFGHRTITGDVIMPGCDASCGPKPSAERHHDREPAPGRQRPAIGRLALPVPPRPWAM